MAVLPPEPLDYSGAPTPPPRRRLIDLSLAFSCVSAAAAVTAVLFLVVPRAEYTFREFGPKLPGTTVLLLKFAHFCQAGGIALVWIIFALPPFLVPLLRPEPAPDAPRRYFRMSRMLLTLFLMFFFGWIVLGLFQPYVAMIDAAANPGK